MFLTALAPNLLALELMRKELSLDISWSRWSLGFLPVGLVLVALLPLLVYLLYPPEIRSSPDVPAWAEIELARMGRPSIQEGLLGLFIVLAFVLWVFGAAWIDATTAVLAVVVLMVLFRVLEWGDIVGNQGAWDTVIYFATLMALADGLNRVGVVTWAAEGVSRQLASASPLAALILLVAFFFVVHYAFASLTAHTLVVFPALLAAGAHFPGMPVKVFAMILAYSIGLMGVITPYATGPAPVYFGSGFIPRRDFWILGFAFGMIYLAVLLGIGLPTLLWAFH
jgi:L-tartrate/succinate antiporter